MASDPPIADNLGDPDRMLDAISNLQTGRRNTGALRRLYGAHHTDDKTVKAIEAKLEQSVQTPKSLPPGPAL
jgi:hypothetical protein